MTFLSWFLWFVRHPVDKASIIRWSKVKVLIESSISPQESHCSDCNIVVIFKTGMFFRFFLSQVLVTYCYHFPSVIVILFSSYSLKLLDKIEANFRGHHQHLLFWCRFYTRFCNVSKLADLQNCLQKLLMPRVEIWYERSWDPVICRSFIKDIVEDRTL